MTWSPGRVALTVAAILVVLAGFVLAPTRESSAHALLESADPGINASLREAPALISANFTEPLEHNFSTLEVYNPSGTRVDSGRPIFNSGDEKKMSTEVEGLTPAIYTVVWKTLSQVDGHSYVGSYTFTLLNPDGSLPDGGSYAFSGTTGSGGAPTGLDGVFKGLGLLAAAALAGVFFFLVFSGLPAASALGDLAVRERSRLLRLGIAVAAVMVAMGLIAETYLLIEQANQLNSGASVLDKVLFDTAFGRWMIFRVVALLMAATMLVFAYRWRGAPVSFGFVVGGALFSTALLFGSSMISHAAGVDQGSFWSTGSDFLHLLFISVWIGSLGFLLLTWLAGRRRVEPDRWRGYFGSMLGRFSALAASSVVLVLVTGITNALIEIPSRRALGDSDYGIVFLVKMGLVLVLLAVGGVNAFVLRPAVLRRAAEKRSPRAASLERRLGGVMALEVGVAVAVFIASGLLTQLPTSRVLEQQADTEVNLDDVQPSAFIGDGHVEGGTLTLLVNPARVGLNRIAVDLEGDTGEVTEILVDLVHETAGNSQYKLEPEDENTYAIEGSFFGLDGQWSIQTTVRRAGEDDVFGEFQATVLPPNPPIPRGNDGGAFDLPAPQLDWNTVGGLWLLAIGGLALLWRQPLAGRWESANYPLLGGAAFALFVGFALVVGGGHQDPGATLENPVPTSDESVAQGEMLYMANCVSCHGQTGRGDGPLGVDLRPPPANFFVHVPFHPDGTLFSWIKDGVPGTAMPAWRDELTEEEMWSLVNYLKANYSEPPPTELEEISAE